MIVSSANKSRNVIRLQHVIITLMSEFSTKPVLVLPELPDMLSSSEGTSRGAVRTMTVKYQRMMQARGPIHRELSSSQRRSGYTSAGFGSPASDRGRVPGEERAREKKASRSLGYSAVRLGVMRSRKNGPCASHLENSTT